MSENIVEFVQQMDELSSLNLDNLAVSYHYSTPNVKLYYPEPFIASPSFIHSDIWFMHILLYQYWLWFAFIFIIVFFFLTFLCTVRWCNNRVKPRRETRGVSRSKCGDLITACVPVTWATSIIVSESTDAIDYYDGFGTTELVIGIRAYQWGWEYYYPKDMDVNFSLKKNYSTFVGNSLKYEKSSEKFADSNNLWKFYQNKNSDAILTPAHLFLVPSDNYKSFNLFNFNDIGTNSLQESNAFKKIKTISKNNNDVLFNLNSRYSNYFKLFSNRYLNEYSLLNSFNFKIQRQNSFINSKLNLNGSSATLDTNSLEKLFLFNFNNNSNSNFFSNDSYSNNYSLSNKNFSLFFSNLLKINFNTDRKNLNFSILKLFTKNQNNSFFSNKNLFNNFLSLNDFLITNRGSHLPNFQNKNVIPRVSEIFSSNQSISLTNRSFKTFNLLKPQSSSPLFNTTNNNVLDTFFKNQKNLNNENLHYYHLYQNKWVNEQLTSSLSKNKIVMPESSYYPIASNNPFIKVKNYDSSSNQEVNVLNGKEESIFQPFNLLYWNFFFNTAATDSRLNNSTNFNFKKNFSYFPLFSLYYDYDFRNWQSLELFEDFYWETANTNFSFDEYFEIGKYNNNGISSVSDIKSYFNNTKNLNESLFSSFFKNFDEIGDNSSLSFFNEDGFTNISLTSSKEFFYLSQLNNVLNIEDSYEHMKTLSYFFFKNNFLNFFNFLNNFKTSHSTWILDMFRSDFDDFNWISSIESINGQLGIDKNIIELFDVSNFVNLDLNLLNNSSNRISSSPALRGSTKNAIVTYNAIQKVFKTRFDELRSQTRMMDVNNSFSKQPFINSSRPLYENLLGKNKHSHFSSIYFVDNFKKNFSNFTFLDNLNSYNIFDFPFLLALKSDSSRYLWIDWFSKWGYLEVQPSSSSRYAIYGMPYFSKPFEYSSSVNENITESETYFLRISRSRKNYLPNWVYSPYFYSKNLSWNINSNFFLNKSTSLLNLLKLNLSESSWFWKDKKLNFLNSSYFLPSNSNINTFNKTSWKPQNSVQSLYYYQTSLIDLLTKREYLLREYFIQKKKILNLPDFLINRPSHDLVLEIKSFFNQKNKNFENSETLNFKNDSYSDFLNEFNANLLKSHSNKLFSSVIENFSYLKEDYNSNKQYKNQYRPMKKGISNMVRLHATGAVAMPIEMRIQILASSKDVIHSWAIPSAGIKIDCVPGYSSHRVMIFLISGIFWGQCMEICGRYHHWMPIIVYFMKRDLFFLWCTHFIFMNPSQNNLSMNDKFSNNFFKTVNFDKNSWIEELN